MKNSKDADASACLAPTACSAHAQVDDASLTVAPSTSPGFLSLHSGREDLG